MYLPQPQQRITGFIFGLTTHELNQYLKPGADLRITMDASRQQPYFKDLVINWRAAERGPHSIIAFRSTFGTS